MNKIKSPSVETEVCQTALKMKWGQKIQGVCSIPAVSYLIWDPRVLFE